MLPRDAKRPRLGGGKENSAGVDEDAEAALMAELLAGLDDSVFSPPSSQSPVKSRPKTLPNSIPVQRERSALQSRVPGQALPRPPTKRAHETQAQAQAHATRPAQTREPLSSSSTSLPKPRLANVPPRHPSRPDVPTSASLKVERAVKREGDLMDTFLQPAKKRVASASASVPAKHQSRPEVKHEAVRIPEGIDRPALPANRTKDAKPQLPETKPLVTTNGLNKVPTSLTSTATLVNLKAEEDNFDDEFDGGFDLAALASMDEADLIPTKYPILRPDAPPAPDGYKTSPWARCTVDSVHDEFLETIPTPEDVDAAPSPTGMVYGKTLVVTFVADDKRRLVHLKERWVDLKIRPGDIVNIVTPALSEEGDSDAPIVITMRTPSYIIHHPDVLVTMTSIASSIPCPRRPLVQALVRIPEPPSKPMLYGTILHSLLQSSLSEQDFSARATRRRIAALGDDLRLELWGAGLEGADADLERAEGAFESFGRRWVRAQPGDASQVVTARDETAGSIAIKGLHEVEEDIWSPKWGLKGKVDASVQAVLHKDGEEGEYVAPLEIKTGRSIGGVSHRAQTMLYTLLMEDRYDLPVPFGLLYYSQRDAIVLVENKANEVRALVMARNELAEWMVREREAGDLRKLAAGDTTGTAVDPVDVEELSVPFLPETLDAPNECDRCYAADVCMLYRKAVDKSRLPHPEDDPIADLFAAKTGHLTPAHAAFFAHWERLLTLEEQGTLRLRAQLWTMTAPARERRGRAFADMVLKPGSASSESPICGRSGRWEYVFVRKPSLGSASATPSLLSGHIAKNDPITLSIEPDLLCLARGYVTALDATSVTVGLGAPLDVTALLRRTHKASVSAADPSDVVFRLDKDELASGMAKMRGYLANLFTPTGDAHRRRLVVDLDAPQFDPTLAPKEHELPRSLNTDQTAAMHRVLTAKDYALILGMPGTGKTTTVAEIIRTLVKRGKSVLLTSYTHSAVDTIVRKLTDEPFRVLRVGNTDKIHPDVRHLTLDAMPPAQSVDELEDRVMGPPVVAATCLSVEHPLFFRRRFDYCIVDEASQITLPTCLGPLRCADTFVLVGDHFQLPPIVRQPLARAGGLDVSLFRRLSDAHPDAVAPLAAQYRMNADIMLLSNRLIYEDRLRCGSTAVAEQTVRVRPRKCADVFHGARCGVTCWVQKLLAEDTKVAFVDTDALSAHETRAGDLVQNPTEGALVHTLATALVAAGVRGRDIGVITPYRQQIKLLTGLFRGSIKAKDDEDADGVSAVEILTADKAQGRDMDVVLVSLVRSNDGNYIGDLLRDWRRINVSFTRARRKLVVFGSARTLGSDRLLADFLALVEAQRWVLRLQPGDEGTHAPVGVKVEEEVKVEEGVKVEEVKVEEEVQVEVERPMVGDENVSPTRKTRRATLGERVIEARPFVREILREIG